MGAHAWQRKDNGMTVCVFERKDPQAQLLLKALQGPRRSATPDRSHKNCQKIKVARRKLTKDTGQNENHQITNWQQTLQ